MPRSVVGGVFESSVVARHAAGGFCRRARRCSAIRTRTHDAKWLMGHSRRHPEKAARYGRRASCRQVSGCAWFFWFRFRAWLDHDVRVPALYQRSFGRRRRVVGRRGTKILERSGSTKRSSAICPSAAKRCSVLPALQGHCQSTVWNCLSSHNGRGTRDVAPPSCPGTLRRHGAVIVRMSTRLRPFVFLSFLGVLGHRRDVGARR